MYYPDKKIQVKLPLEDAKAAFYQPSAKPVIFLLALQTTIAQASAVIQALLFYLAGLYFEFD